MSASQTKCICIVYYVYVFSISGVQTCTIFFPHAISSRVCLVLRCFLLERHGIDCENEVPIYWVGSQSKCINRMRTPKNLINYVRCTYQRQNSAQPYFSDLYGNYGAGAEYGYSLWCFAYLNFGYLILCKISKTIVRPLRRIYSIYPATFIRHLRNYRFKIIPAFLEEI